MNTADTLRAARALIAEPRCWNQGRYVSRTDDNCLCAAGAINRVETGFTYPVSPISTAMPALAQTVIDRSDAMRPRLAVTVIAGWQDHPDRTHDEVLAAFDAAIVTAESETT